MDLELIWNGSSTLLSMIGLSWMKNIELTPRCIYTANLPLSLFNTKDTQVKKTLCEFLTIKKGITSTSAILLTRISFQRSQREDGEGRIGTAHWAQVPRCKDAQTINYHETKLTDIYKYDDAPNRNVFNKTIHKEMLGMHASIIFEMFDYIFKYHDVREVYEQFPFGNLT